MRGGLETLTLANTLVAAALFFLCDDLVWAPLHRLFHSHGGLYKAFHKFHHKQLAPSRGLADAFMNAPSETIVGLVRLCSINRTYLVSMLGYTTGIP